MRLKILIFFFCASSITYAQNERRITFNFNLTPKLSFEKTESRFEIPDDAMSQQNVLKIDLSSGILMNYKISEKLFIASGLLYSRDGFKTKTKGYDPKLIKNLFKESTGWYHFHFINIPAYVKYAFSNNQKYKLLIQSGLEYNYLLSINSKHKDLINDHIETWTTKEDFEGTRRHNISASFSFVFNTLFSKNIGLNIGPTFEIMLLDQLEGPDNIHLWNLGLLFETYYNF